MEVVLGEVKPSHVDWEVELDSWEKSGLSGAAYSRERGLAYSAFGYHKRKRESMVPPQLVALTEKGGQDRAESKESGVVIGLEGSCYRVLVASGFDEKTLIRVLSLLAKAG